MVNNSIYKIKDWINDRQKRGRITFSFQEVKDCFPEIMERGVKSALNRLVKKSEIVPVLKGFYAVIPIGYALRGMVLPELYIDDLMKYLNRRYYISLLNAAVFFGAAHQQPQIFSVTTSYPPLRETIKKGSHIIFIITRKTIPQMWLKPFRTEYGDIQVSKPELTAADLITFQKEIGGLNRACTVLYELAESINFEQLDKDFFDYVPTATIQRLGYLLENELEQPNLAEILFVKSQEFNCKFQKIPLKYSIPAKDCETNAKWKIVINETIIVLILNVIDNPILIISILLRFTGGGSTSIFWLSLPQV
jgi:predicted transcriptional regulator of viral defense system